MGGCCRDGRRGEGRPEGVLADYPLGSTLLLLAELTEEEAHAVQGSGDDGRGEQLAHASHALFVVGLGLHAVLPR